MDKSSFGLLAIEDKLILLKTEAEKLTEIDNLSNLVTLYSYEGFLIEEYRNRETKDLIKIEPIMKDNEAERLKLYSMYIRDKGSAEGLSFKTEEEKRYVFIVCSGCEYEMLLDGSKKVMEAMPTNCPICDGDRFKMK